MGDLARGNAARLTRVLVDQDGHADLYRTCIAGPSGQRNDKRIARVYYTFNEPYELEIFNVDSPCFPNEINGYAHRTYHNGARVWSITADLDNDGIRWWGYAATLSLGCDVLINGEHAALRNHDHARISRGKWERNPHLARA